MIRKILALTLVGLMLSPILVNIAEARSYYYKGKAIVASKYRYVGFTPQKIIIKTNVRFDKTPFDKPLGGWWCGWKTLTVKTYYWDGKKYALGHTKTYHNTFNNLGGIINKEFSCEATWYYKRWWHRFIGKSYLQLIITIPKDKGLTQWATGKAKIWVQVKAEGARYVWGKGFENLYITVTGSGTYKVRATPWEKYKKYWGYTASAEEYNQIIAQQNGEEEIVEGYDTLDVMLLSLFILGVSILSYIYVSDKKKRR